MSLLQQRARDSGKCPPLLLSEDRVVNDDGFETAVLNLLDDDGMKLGSGDNVAADYREALKMAENVLKIPGELDLDRKRSITEHRRCLLLALLSPTPSTSPTLKAILANGLLSSVKSWLDDILNGTIGGVDLLLHLLSSITDLPVTKSMVVDSGMGKAIRDIEKHKICKGTANETAIKTRVQAVKDAWNASVKANKDPSKKKRALQSEENLPAKKKKVSAFSSLVQKASSNNGIKTTSSDETETDKNRNGSSARANNSGGAASNGDKETAERKEPKKSSKRVKWADHFGGSLQSARQINDEGIESSHVGDQSKVSWSDRKKRDRLREKEILAKAKKAKIVDDDDDEDDSFNTIGMHRMTPTVSWHQPKQLPDRSEVPKAQCSSKEIATQVERKARVTAVRYLSEEDVPSSPFPITDVEEALDVASRASSVTGTIPFFAAQLAASAPAPITAPAPAQLYPVPPPGIPPPPPPPLNGPPVGASPVGATIETLQAMGLPLFLVGCNVQALQTLAQTPSLLSTFVNSNGQYDQPRLMSLVQALTQNLAPSQQVQQPPSYQQPLTTGMSYAGQAPSLQSYQVPAAVAPSTYGGGSTASTSHYGPQSTTTSTTVSYGVPPSSQPAYRTSVSDAGNLHVSGYGPMTTQTDIIALFTPYVQVDEVVMKPNFSFVNTSDPEGAKRAREVLQGAMLGGAPIRINAAQRRAGGAPPPPAVAYGAASSSLTASAAAATTPAPLPMTATGEIDYSNIRDDRGNPATKNLFVAGYGLSTTEQQLREFFSQYCTITGCVMKGTFAFVNTADKSMAVRVRETLGGTSLNGGTLRINFAKETGRLGTSFDTTYGPNAPSHSHYSR